MTLLYLLDTNIISDATREFPNLNVEHRLTRLQANCALAAPTVEELIFGISRLPGGARKSKLLQWLEGVLDRFPVLSYDEKCARWLGQQRARLSAKGKTAPRTDGEIAAVASANGLILVTRNSRDFQFYSELAVENWFTSVESTRK